MTEKDVRPVEPPASAAGSDGGSPSSAEPSDGTSASSARPINAMNAAPPPSFDSESPASTQEQGSARRLRISGAVDAYTPATAREPGIITVGGLPFPLAAGTTLAGDSVVRGLGVNLDAQFDASGRIARGTATRDPSDGELPSRVCFFLELTYLVVLIAGALVYHDTGHDAIVKPVHDFLVALFPDPIGSIPLVVPWLGALGSVTRGLANSYGEVDFIERSPSRPRYYNSLAWYIGRPFVGAVFGIFVFIFFLTVVDPSGKSKPGGEYGIDILAFIVGYADGTFVALIQRAINVLLGPGDPNASGGMRSSPAARPSDD